MTLIVFAPNWLGDAVMALPALADLRRHGAGGRLVVAARHGVAPLFQLVPGVDAVLTLAGVGLASAFRSLGEDARAVRAIGASTAVLFPNSFRTALTAKLAGVPERWGYRRDLRSFLLTRDVPRTRGSVHQVDQYRVLAAGTGASNGDREPAIDVPASVGDEARAMLAERGWDGISPLVGFAPGAAYGGAKRWPPDRVARAIGTLTRDRGATCVLVGGPADAATTRAVVAEAGKMNQSVQEGRLIDMAGQTDLVRLAGVMSACSAFVSNDSGAMHLAAAVGTPVVAVFGPTNEHATAPVARKGRRATVVTGAAWCRPCGLRECPLDHRCMTSVPVDRVVQAVGEAL